MIKFLFVFTIVSISLGSNAMNRPLQKLTGLVRPVPMTVSHRFFAAAGNEDSCKNEIELLKKQVEQTALQDQIRRAVFRKRAYDVGWVLTPIAAALPSMVCVLAGINDPAILNAIYVGVIIGGGRQCTDRSAYLEHKILEPLKAKLVKVNQEIDMLRINRKEVSVLSKKD